MAKLGEHVAGDDRAAAAHVARVGREPAVELRCDIGSLAPPQVTHRRDPRERERRRAQRQQPGDLVEDGGGAQPRPTGAEERRQPGIGIGIEGDRDAAVAAAERLLDREQAQRAAMRAERDEGDDHEEGERVRGRRSAADGAAADRERETEIAGETGRQEQEREKKR